jgi:hypothetical protein
MNNDGLRDLLNPQSYIWYKNGNTFTNDYSRFNYSINKTILGQFTPDGNPDFAVGGIGGKITLYNQRFDEKMEYLVEIPVTGANITTTTNFREMTSFDREGWCARGYSWGNRLDLDARVCLIGPVWLGLQTQYQTHTYDLSGNQQGGLWTGALQLACRF